MTEYEAKWVDETCFGYVCDLCPKEHIYGCSKDFINNRVENRGNHCLKYKSN